MIRKRCMRAGLIPLLPLLVLGSACRSSGGSGGSAPVAAPAAASEACPTVAPPPYRPTAEEAERDDILSLLAYAVGHRTWQPTCSPAGDACPPTCRDGRA